MAAEEHKAFDKARMSRFWDKVKAYVANATDGFYTKPSGGIPKSDLSGDVQTSLGKADSALQEHQDISGKQDVILDLEDIRDGAAKGKTALQSFTETDPTVPSWAKQPSKPSYTASEVGALPTSTTLANLQSDTGHRTVTDAQVSKWNAKQDALTGYAEEQFVFTLADNTTVTKTILVK